MNQLFHEIKKNGYATYKYNSDTQEKWRITSGIIGNRCKAIIQTDSPLLFPPTSNRMMKFGMIAVPKNVDVTVETKNNMNNFIFSRRKNLF